MKRALAAGLAAVTLSGCGALGLSDTVLPGSVGTGDDGYQLTVALPDAGNLVTNGEVKIDDRTIGTITKIALDGFTPTVTISVLDSVQLPVDTEARVGQKSLLGSEYIELSVPPESKTSQMLQAGDSIGLEQAGRYTDTEDVLAALSLWLNGGGLQHVQTISSEINTALVGNEKSARELFTNVDRLMVGLDGQKTDIVAAITEVNALTKRLAAQKERLDGALGELPSGLTALERQRDDLTQALAALDDLSVVTNRVVTTSGADLVTELQNLQPVLRELADAADSIPEALDIAGTVLFPVRAVPYVVKGDYLNAAVTFDVTNQSLVDGFVPNSPVADGIALLQTAMQAGDPLTGPLTDAINQTTDPEAFPSGSPKIPQAEVPAATSDAITKLLSSLLGGGR